ncbi:MAG: hypothetical protein ACTSXP_05895 [Promethearchaeota archaeon]
MVLRLKIIKRSNSSGISNEALRHKFEKAVDDIAEVFPEIRDNTFQAFVIDKVAQLSTDLEKEPEPRFMEFSRLRSFIDAYKDKSVSDLKKEHGNGPLKDIFAKFELDSGAVNKTLEDVDNISKIEIPDAHVYLKGLEFLDDINSVEDGVPRIEDIVNKLIAVINLSLPLLEIAAKADREEEKQFRKIKKIDELPREAAEKWMEQFRSRQSIQEVVDGILNLVTGDQTKLLTRRIYKNTRDLKEQWVKIKDLEYKIENLEKQRENPALYFLQQDDVRFNELMTSVKLRMLSEELESERGKLADMVSSFVGSEKHADLMVSIKKLEKHVNVNIIGAVNDTITRISATGLKSLVIPKIIEIQARNSGIKVESILKKKSIEIMDKDIFWDKHIKFKEKISNIIENIKKIVNVRLHEEKVINQERTFAAINDCINLLVKTGQKHLDYENPYVECIIDSLKLHLLEDLTKKIKIMNVLISAKHISMDDQATIIDQTGKRDLLEIAKSVVQDDDSVIAKLIDVSTVLYQKLQKHAPLSAENYNSAELLAIHDNIMLVIQNLALLIKIREKMQELAKNLELLDESLPRKLIALPSFSQIDNFKLDLDSWFTSQQGEIYLQGGSAKQKQILDRIESIKKMIDDLNSIISLIPPGMLDKVETYPLKY